MYIIKRPINQTGVESGGGGDASIEISMGCAFFKYKKKFNSKIRISVKIIIIINMKRY